MAGKGALRISYQGGVGRVEWQALGTGVVVLTADTGRTAAAALEVRNQLLEIDAACSRFRPDSELEVANRANGHLVVIGPLLSQAIATSLWAARVTGGLVDPTVGAAMDAIGYDRDFGQIPPWASDVVDAKPAGAWRHIQLNPKWGTLHVPDGVKLDLGAIAKALAADRAATSAQQKVGVGVLVSIGGDIATAGASPEQGWNVRVTDWHGSAPTAPGQTVRIDSGGLATSSTTMRRWVRGENEMHHFVNPLTGRPTTVVWRTVSVHAGSCVDANIAATASIIMGENAVTWLSEHGLSARLVRPNGSSILVGGWPASQIAA